jgi:integrase
VPRLFKRADSPYLWCAGYDPRTGELWKESTKQVARGAARKAARAIERRRLEEPASSGLLPMPLSEALDGLRVHKARKKVAKATLEKLEQKRKHLERLLGAQRNVHELALLDVESYLDARRAETVRRVELVKGEKALERTERDQAVSDHTIAMEVGVLLEALRRLKKHGLYDGDPDALWPEALDSAIYTPRDRWLTQTEARALLLALTAHRRRYVQLYILTGLRRSELYQCERVGDVLRVRQTKGNAKVNEVKIREVPLCAEARAILDAHPLPWVRWEGGRMGDDLKRAAARAGIAHVSANDLRRTFVSWLANAGVPELAVIRLVGHNSSAMVRRVYAQLAPATLAEAVARLPGLSIALRRAEDGSSRAAARLDALCEERESGG